MLEGGEDELAHLPFRQSVFDMSISSSRTDQEVGIEVIVECHFLFSA
jgi:hypothetical protein